MKKFLVFFLFLNCFAQQSQWTILVFMQANNDLSKWAHYSLSHMQAGVQNTKNINVLVEWDHINVDMISRYKIIPGEMELIDTFLKSKVKDHKQSLVDSFAWAMQEFPAEHYALILWDHGTGILDYEPHRLMFTGGRSLQKKRGILKDDLKNAIYTNQDLYDCFLKINNLLGKKLDILIMDACYMQMLEVCYQLREFVQYIIASQEYESGEGLPYGLFLYNLTLDAHLQLPKELCKNIVQSYDLFYKKKQDHEFYTFSAVNVNLIEEIKFEIDKFVDAYFECKKYNELDIYELINNARTQTEEIFWDDYVDLFCFLNNLYKLIDMTIKKNNNVAYKNSLLNLKHSLNKCSEMIKNFIIANVVGSSHLNSYGISIYFPVTEKIHESYYKTIFAKNCRWIKFLEEFC